MTTGGHHTGGWERHASPVEGLACKILNTISPLAIAGRQHPYSARFARRSGPWDCLPILAVLLFLPTACSDSAVEPGSTEPPPQDGWVVIQVVSGGNQYGIEGSQLADPIIVYVTDPDGAPGEGLQLRFSAVHGEGLVLADGSPPSRTLDVTTDARGMALVEWRLGPMPEHILKVSVSPESNGASTHFMGMPIYVFGGMAVEMTIQWMQGVDFNTNQRAIAHDGRILETPHFLTFSDGSTNDAKVVFAAMAEESLHEILRAFGVSDGRSLGIDPSDPVTKLTIYSNRTFQHEQTAYSFRFGFIAGGRDSGAYQSMAMLRQVVKHELTHVFGMLVDFRWSGPEGPGQPGSMFLLDSWFSEGLSEYVAGGSWTPIQTLDEMNVWRAQQDHTNPIAIREWSNFPSSVIERSNGFEYYPMFDLAVRYLMDEAGLGRSLPDVMAMFLDINTGAYGFRSAFEKHMGISVEEYEDRFFALMADYLSLPGPQQHLRTGIREDPPGTP